MRCTATGPPVASPRPQDRAESGDFMAIMGRYAEAVLYHPEPPPIPFEEVDRTIIVGSNRLVRKVQDACAGLLKPFFAR
ncbi:MAG: hypothetical protein ACYDB1_06710 [Acidiferrobacteraceae bacterium]